MVPTYCYCAEAFFLSLVQGWVYIETNSRLTDRLQRFVWTFHTGDRRVLLWVDERVNAEGYVDDGVEDEEEARHARDG